MNARTPQPAPPTRVLCSSPNPPACLTGGHALDPSQFEVSCVVPGPGYIQAVRDLRPAVVVLDRVDDRPDAARMEVAVARDLCPEARVIAISERSSESDAQIVEQGIFYYLASTEERELIRVIHAAAQSFHHRQERTAT